MSPGSRIASYELQQELGRGGMAVVFRAHDPAIGRAVAVKIIRSDSYSTAQEMEQLRLRFAREAAAAGKLSHPNIVTIYQLGEQNGAPFMVMELIQGSSLSQLISKGNSLGPTLEILRQTAAALDYAHSQGIVHRDVKPSNIMVREDGSVKLTDFGIAHITAQTVTRCRHRSR
jgi:eukaryotic-like serine/threonine-protein kinase